MTSAVISTDDGAISWIRLNRPERLNAMNGDLVNELSAALAAAEARTATRVIILHGEGRAFCSGDDLRDLDAQTISEAATQAWVESIQDITLQIMQSRKIVIAAVHGWCVGGALEWVVNCDFRLFADTTRWFFPEVGYGLFVTGGVTALLTKQVGPQVAKELMILGERHDAARASRGRHRMETLRRGRPARRGKEAGAGGSGAPRGRGGRHQARHQRRLPLVARCRDGARDQGHGQRLPVRRGASPGKEVLNAP
jgi:1,4-dihydroxy-2-naphthoyl-CoA synthase